MGNNIKLCDNILKVEGYNHAFYSTSFFWKILLNFSPSIKFFGQRLYFFVLAKERSVKRLPVATASTQGRVVEYGESTSVARHAEQKC